MLHVSDVARSIRFYELLGFETIDCEGPANCPRLGAHALRRGCSDVLVGGTSCQCFCASRAACLVRPRLTRTAGALAGEWHRRPTDQLSGIHAEWRNHDQDPDGYTVGINHWPEAVHQEWLKDIERKRKSGLLPA